MLLGAACADSNADELEHLSVGQRDERLLQLREWAFGERVQIVADCPACGDKLELEFNVADLRSTARPESRDPLFLAAAPYEVRFRLPTVADLASLPRDAADSGNRSLLLERCVLNARADGQLVPAGQLPEAIVSELGKQMAAADPLAEVQLALTCPACAHQWRATFDIASFFWTEINAWALRILHEVHALASAYGWTEADILKLSPRRRQAYLELIGA
jgi:hypothetical protein